MKKAVSILTLAIAVIIMLSTVPAIASSKSTIKSIAMDGTLYATQGSVFDLPKAIVEKDLLGISLFNEKGTIVA